MHAQNHETTEPFAPSTTVEGFVLRTWWNIDHEDGGGGERFFAPDGVCQMPAMTMSGRQEIADGYAARRAAGNRVSRHLVSNLLVEAPIELRVEARYTLVLHAGAGPTPLPLRLPQAVCDVVDRLIRSEDGFLIEHRRLEAVFIAEDTDSVMLRKRR